MTAWNPEAALGGSHGLNRQRLKQCLLFSTAKSIAVRCQPQGNEVKDLYAVFWRFAVTVNTSPNSQLREIPAARLRDALMDVLLSCTSCTSCTAIDTKFSDTGSASFDVPNDVPFCGSKVKSKCSFPNISVYAWPSFLLRNFAMLYTLSFLRFRKGEAKFVWQRALVLSCAILR